MKWWTQPAGALTADLHGEIGAGYVETAPAIAAALLAALSTVTITNTAAMVTARPEIAGIHIVDENETVAEALDRLLLGSALVWPLNADGTMTLREISFASPVESLISLDVQRDAAFKPIKSRRLGYRRNELLMSAGDISAILTEPDASGNLIPNPRLELDADGWTVTGATVVNASTGWPAPIGFEFTGTGSARSARQDIVNNGGAFISTQAKRTAAAVMNFNVYWYDAAGGALTTTSEDVTPVASATWEFIDIYIDVPVGAVAFEAELEVASNSGVVDFAGARLGLTEIGGDVTARNAPVMPLPLNVTIEYDSTGTVPQSGQYPALVQFSRQKGGYDVTATTGFSIIATTGNIVATGGTPNASIDNTLGSPTRGLLTVNSPGIGRVTVKTTRPREPDLTQTIELLMHKAAPPTPSTDNTPGDVTSTSDNITSDVLAMQATDTTITCTASLTFRCGSSGSNLNSNVKGKFRRSASSDMSSPTDVGSFVNGSAETAAMEPIFKDPGSPGGDGSLTVTQNDTGRTIGVTYYYQFVEQAISADAYPIHQFGTIQVTA